MSGASHLEIDVCNRQRTVAVPARRISQAARTAALHAGGFSGGLSIVLVGERKMRQLNREFAGVRGTTDVLAFDLQEGPEAPCGDIAGEVIVNAALAAREARRRDKSPVDELLLYVVHGVLHLCGYRDGDDEQRGRMRAAERAVLADIGAWDAASGGGP